MVLTSKEDPSIKLLRSGFGKQVKSFNESNPSWGFGSSHRDASNKLYLSPEQAKATPVVVSQGPVYKNYSGIGNQLESKFNSSTMPGFGTSTRNEKIGKNVPGPGAYPHEGGIGIMKESKRSTSPRAIFGTASRDQQNKVWLDDELMKTFGGRESPGPNSYKNQPGVGKQVCSRYPTAPGWKQSTSERFNAASPTRNFPGAGSYLVPEALGKQTLSSKKTLPSVKIGSGDRDAFKKIFISKEHEKSAFGLNSPGPMTSKFLSAVGSQPLSSKQSMPSWGFGTAKRSKGYETGTPGPGSYYA